MNPNAISNFCSRVNCDIWEQIDLFTELAIRSEINTGLQNGARSDSRAFSHNTVRSNVCRRVHIGRSQHNRGLMNPRSKRRLGKEDCQHFGEGYAGIGHAISTFLDAVNKPSTMTAEAALCSARPK